MAIEITDDDLAEPSIAFAKLIQVVQEGQRDTKKGFALTQQQIEHAFAKAMRVAAPDYGEELKRIKTAIQAIEQKPALGLTAETLGKSIQQGSADAVSALKSAATDYKKAQEREASLLDKFESTSWIFFLILAAFLLASGWGLGFMMSGNLAKPIQVLSLLPIATAADCKTSGGNMGTDKEKRPVCTLLVRP